MSDMSENVRILGMMIGLVIVVVLFIVGLIYLSGGMMTRSCDVTDKQEVVLYSGKRIVAEVCMGEWK